MPNLTEQQWGDLKRRRSQQDLNDLIAALELEGSVAVDGHTPPEDEEAKANLEEQVANSRLFDEIPDGAPPATDEETAGNVEAAEDAGELEPGAEPKTKSSTTTKATADKS